MENEEGNEIDPHRKSLAIKIVGQSNQKICSQTDDWKLVRQSWLDRKAEAAKKNLFEIKRQRVKYLLNNEIESEPVKREDEENKQF